MSVGPPWPGMTTSAPSAAKASQEASQSAVTVSSKMGSSRSWKAMSPAITSLRSGSQTEMSPGECAGPKLMSSNRWPPISTTCVPSKVSSGSVTSVPSASSPL